MLIKRFRLQAPNEDLPESGTDVQEMEPEDSGEPEQLEQEPEETGDETVADAEEAHEIVTLDDEPEEENQRPWVNDLRKRYREEQKARRQLEEQLKAVQGGTKADELPPKPTIENPGTGNDSDAFDADVYERQLEKWYAKKVEFDRRKEQERAAMAEVEKQFKERQELYATGKAKFQKEAIQEAEEEVVSTLPQNRQAMLLDAAEDPASLVMALGKSPETLRKLASIKSDVQFIKEIVKAEMKIQSAPKRTAPPPERTVSGAGKTPGSTANKLEKLKEEAQKSGNYDAYYAEKRRLGK